nr:hypothetical protein [Tanacetum cinerariifolium]
MMTSIIDDVSYPNAPAAAGHRWHTHGHLHTLLSVLYHHHAAGTSSLVSFRNEVQAPLYCWMIDVPISPDCSIDEEPIDNQHSLRVFSFGYIVQMLLLLLVYISVAVNALQFLATVKHFLDASS